MRPSVEIVITCQGMNLPLSCSARLAACSIPPQQGTCMRTAHYLEVDRSGLSAEIGKLCKGGVLLSRRKQFELLSPIDHTRYHTEN